MLCALSRAKGGLSLRVEGSSMLPLLRTGDAVELSALREVRIGDVAACWRDGRLVLHRVVRRRRHEGTWQFLTKGDNSRAFDAGWVGQESMVGVLRKVNGEPHRPGPLALRLAAWLSRATVRLRWAVPPGFGRRHVMPVLMRLGRLRN